ncbi:MAG: glucose-6-phosphate isomerase [Opitutales bacterium]|nr:glucose-6-phosphate isomerase [Opitutales bacterium]
MNNWNTFCQRFFSFENPKFSLDLSRVNYPESYFQEMAPQINKAFEEMQKLESGAIANPDENRMVGHYWLRTPELAPQSEITSTIQETLKQIESISAKVHSGEIIGAGGKFKNLLVIGIGGSALGPQFVGRALSNPEADVLTAYYFDNTDPDGIDLTLKQIGDGLGQTLSVVISKSGGTPETRNGMLEAQNAYHAAGLDFAKHAIAVTGEGSKLDQVAESEGWLARLPMWDWVGGRTSETAAVGLLPAALQGLDFKGMLKGAKQMDALTRIAETTKNPAALLALMWYFLTEGKGSKDMVVLPYKDRLELFSKYLQQLIMESLGKELDLDGNVVNQGIAVYGNKGSTDQHAYVQQLREGLLNFFAIFIEVLGERTGDSIEVEPGITSGDYLQGFYLGTRDALYEKGRQSISITVQEVSAETVGALIALFERTVGLYATLININAYHQPGVEAGKKAAAGILDLKTEVREFLRSNSGKLLNIDEIAKGLSKPEQAELIYKIVVAAVSNDTITYSSENLNSPSQAKVIYKG